jgi:tetratricopeptide (TPR) repeat protein
LAAHSSQCKDYQKSIEYSTRLLQICEERGDTTEACEACHSLAGAFTALNQMDEAVKYLELRATISERAQQNADGKETTDDAERNQTSTLGNILVKTLKFDEAIKFFDKNFKNARKASQLSQEKWIAKQRAALFSKLGVGGGKKKSDSTKDGDSDDGEETEHDKEGGDYLEKGDVDVLGKNPKNKKKGSGTNPNKITPGVTATRRFVFI